MYRKYSRRSGLLEKCILVVFLISLILSMGFQPGQAEASWLTKTVRKINEALGLSSGGTSTTTNSDETIITTTTTTPTNTTTFTYSNTYTNTVNGEVVASFTQKMTSYTVTGTIDGVEQKGTLVDDGIMLKYDDGMGSTSYLIPGDGQMLFLEKSPSQEIGYLPTDAAFPTDRALTLKTTDAYGNYVNVSPELVDPNKIPVVITHGSGGSFGDMLTLGSKYDPDKYQVFYADYGSKVGIDNIAAALADKVNNDLLPSYPGKTSIVFEQHSMGAAVVYYAAALELFDLSKIDKATMFSLAPLHGSLGKAPSWILPFVAVFHPTAAQANSLALFADLNRKGLPSNFKLFIVGTTSDKTIPLDVQLALKSNGLITVDLGHVEVVTAQEWRSLFSLFEYYGGTFVRTVGNWNMYYKDGKLSAFYYNNFYGTGEGLVFTCDSAGNCTQKLEPYTYIGDYRDGDVMFVDEKFNYLFNTAYNPDGSRDMGTEYGSIHYNAEGTATGYLITTGIENNGAIYITLNGTGDQTFTVLYKTIPSSSVSGQSGGGVTPVDSTSDTTPPTAPGVPTASSPNTVQLTLTWTASTDASGIDKYLVYRGVDGSGSMSLIATVTTNSYIEFDLSAGNYRYQITAVDKAGLSSNSAVSPVIKVERVFRPPVLNSIGSKTISERDNVSFRISATDPDGDWMWFGAEGLPPGATFSGQTFSWTPTFSQIGTYYVTFNVSDGFSRDSETIALTVIENQPPALRSIGNKSIKEGSNLVFGVSAADTYGSRLVYSVTGLPAGATFKEVTHWLIGPYHQFSWTPTSSQAGSYNVTFTVSDGSLTNSGTITITVANVNQPPVMTAIGTKSVNEGANLVFTVSATDPDGDTLTYSATGLPAGATFDASTRAFNWTPTYNQSGSYSVTFKAVDPGGLSASATAAITVVNVPVPDLVTIGLSTTAGRVVPGDTVTLSNVVMNQGPAAAGSFAVAFSLSKDAIYGGTDDIAFAATRPVTSLAAGASSSASTTVVVPTAMAGYYYVCAKADSGNTVNETNEANNGLCTTSIEVVLPDVVMTAVSGPTIGTKGSVIGINNTVKNQGVGSAASFTVGLYLSADATITTADLRIGARGVSSLAAGVSSSATTGVMIPTTIAAGTYYIGAIADYSNSRPESNETNNARTGNTIVVQ